MRPHVGLQLMIEDPFREAVLPLFRDAVVEALEWSFDVGWSRPVPAWADDLLGLFAGAGRLYGHGVSYSALAARDAQQQERWLEALRHEVGLREYRHVSEHFGFMRGGRFTQGAPLPVPLTPETLAYGRARLVALAEAARCPVGLENLALAFGRREVLEQGPFLDALLEPVDGFLLLDLHNVYCQLANFDLSADELLDRYPLGRVRELHVSGGSWSQPLSSPSPFRRDTHDDRVPDEVFELVPLALERCPDVELVVLERLGYTVHGDEQAEALRNDFHRLKQVVEESARARC